MTENSQWKFVAESLYAALNNLENPGYAASAMKSFRQLGEAESIASGNQDERPIVWRGAKGTCVRFTCDKPAIQPHGCSYRSLVNPKTAALCTCCIDCQRKCSNEADLLLELDTSRAELVDDSGLSMRLQQEKAHAALG